MGWFKKGPECKKRGGDHDWHETENYGNCEHRQCCWCGRHERRATKRIPLPGHGPYVLSSERAWENWSLYDPYDGGI